jgi:intracellular sulfur oxidation DsrE/DsrF family protein
MSRYHITIHSQRLGLGPDDLLPQVHLISSGVGELVRKPAEGWANLRP